MLISREIEKWGWYRDANTFRVFFHLLLKAQNQDGEYMGVKVLRGQVVTGRKQLSSDLGISEQGIRTAIDHLIKSGEINQQSTNKFSVITICKYDSWKRSSETTTQQSTSNQPATYNENNHIQRIKELEERIEQLEKEKEELAIASKKKSRLFVPPTVDEVHSFILEQGFHFDADAFVNFYESKGWLVGKNKMKDWRAACRTWERKRCENTSSPQSREEIGVILHGNNTGKYDSMDLWK